MLEPNGRVLLVDAIQPPSGFSLTDAIATTHSLDLDALLLAPTQLVLAGASDTDRPPEDRVGLLGALRRAAAKMTVYCEAGRILEPPQAHLLYGLLESMVVSSRAPNGGSFHAKMWLLHFKAEDPDEAARMRLLVLSRNLTFDRCWDVSLALDGVLRGRPVAVNRALAEFVAALPSTATPRANPVHAARAERLAEAVRFADWELPPGFDEIAFHPLGIGGKLRAWLPQDSQRLLVISPFLSAPALVDLAASSTEPVALVSRAEELDALGTPPPFPHTFMLAEGAELDDGEDTSGAGLFGLHAKVYVAKQGWTTRVYLGSANATTAALGSGKAGPRNVELLVELAGKTSRVGGIDELLGEDGLMPVLQPWRASAAPPVDENEVAAEKALENARRSLVGADLIVCYESAGTDWRPVLAAARSPDLSGILSATVHLVTTHSQAETSVFGVSAEASVSLPVCDTASCTGFVTIALVAARAPSEARFVLALPTEGLPPARDAEIVRAMIRDGERFLAYVLALLGLGGLDLVGNGTGSSKWSRTPAGSIGDELSSGMLERLIRAKSRDPFALEEIEHLVAQLASTPEGERIIPAGFRSVWDVLRATEIV